MNITDIKEFFTIHNKVVVALSGGVDSAVLLLLAEKYADEVYACFVKSEFQPDFELEDAEIICDYLGAKLNIINISVLDEHLIIDNPEDRCYYCKKKMFTYICEFAKSCCADVVEGTNLSDDVNERAGFRAINELGVYSPLKDCGFTKSDIRIIAENNAIPVNNKPSYACLATRIPYGTEISVDILAKTQLAESYLFALGFSDFRIRYNNGNAILEFTSDDREAYLSQKDIIDEKLLSYYNCIMLSKKVR